MPVIQKKLSRTFQRFFESEKAGGLLLVAATALSLLIANLTSGDAYASLWQMKFGGLSVEHWINDGLMAIFFLLIGLELERELYSGELTNLKLALLPITAALGGICIPALIHFILNGGSPTQPGAGIPMATDIAFALGILALLGRRVPASLKVFLTALAVIDDLGAIVIIALFYTTDVSAAYLSGAIAVLALLALLNRRFKVMSLIPYLLGGGLVWFLMLKSGVHATIAGVLLAFVIPYSSKAEDQASPSHRLEHFLQRPVAFMILPLFAFANTGIVIASDWAQGLASANSIGIVAGLVLGKPLGIVLFTIGAVAAGLCRLPLDLTRRHVVGAGLLGGVGFTMSIFIANLAFPADAALITSSKIAILAGSLTAGLLGFVWLYLFGKPAPFDFDPDTMDIEATDHRSFEREPRTRPPSSF